MTITLNGTPTDIRINRLRAWEREALGSRIDSDGVMYQNYIEFLEWAKAYDTGGLDMRSKVKHEELF